VINLRQNLFYQKHINPIITKPRNSTCVSMLVFYVKTPCGLVGTVVAILLVGEEASGAGRRTYSVCAATRAGSGRQITEHLYSTTFLNKVLECMVTQDSVGEEWCYVLCCQEKKFWNAVPACVLLRKNFWNTVPACSVTKVSLLLYQ
jgi:hypothetical protein